MYDAFISYRHAQLDKFVAENLHKKLEAFRLPKSIIKQRGNDCKKKIERVFRDRDELPLASNLADPIMQALEESEFLIVICSPRLLESRWCKKEIETFISMHGREKVLAVLIEGEPDESFPEELLYRESVITNEDGSTQVVRVPMEPLAADVRGKNKKEILKAMDEELLRLAAAMFGCGYDDLKQRHKEQKMKKLLTASLAASSIFLVFGAVSTAMALRIRTQKEQIEQQNVQIEVQYQEALRNQSRSLAEKSLETLADGDRLGALHTALEAFEEVDAETPMPVTAEAEYALTESSYVYQNGEKMVPFLNYTQDTSVLSMQASQDGQYLLSTDRAGGVYVWKAEDGQLVYRIQTGAFDNQYERECRFLTNELVAYLKEDGLEIYDLSKEEVVFRTEDRYHMVVPSADGKYFAVGVMDMVHGNTLTVYDMASLEEVVTYTFEGNYDPGEMLVFDEENKQLVFVKQQGILKEKVNTEIVVMSLETGQITAEYPLEYSDVAVLKMDGSDLYACVNQTLEDKFPDGEYDYTASMRSQILKINLDTKKVQWELEAEGSWISDCHLASEESARHLLAVYSADVRLFDMDTGEMLDSYGLGSEVVNTIPLEAPDHYAMLTRSGDFHVISGEDRMDYSYGDYFSLGAANICSFEAVDVGYALLPYGSKTIVYYARVLGVEGKEVAQMEESVSGAVVNEQETYTLLASFPDGEKSQIILLNSVTQEIIATLDFNGYQTFMGFVGDGTEYFYAGDSDGNLNLYRVEDGKAEKSFETPEYFTFHEVIDSADGSHVIFEYFSEISILDLNSGTWEMFDAGENSSDPAESRKVAMGTKLSLYARTDVKENAIQILSRDKDEIMQQIPVPVTYLENLFFMADDTALFAQYLDGSADVFSVESGEVIAEFEPFATRIEKILPAGDGYVFFGVGVGWLINQELEVTARIPGCRAILPKSQKVISSNGNLVYQFPLYTAEELVEKGKEIY